MRTADLDYKKQTLIRRENLNPFLGLCLVVSTDVLGSRVISISYPNSVLYPNIINWSSNGVHNIKIFFLKMLLLLKEYIVHSSQVEHISVVVSNYNNGFYKHLI